MPTCPNCGKNNVHYREKRSEWLCLGCDHTWTAPAPRLEAAGRAARPLQIFLSYGHDEHTPDARRIKDDLEARGHKVWFDDERLRAGRDWEALIEQGLHECDLVLLLMTPYAVRQRKSGDPTSRDGYCLNELAKAIEKNKTIIPVLLVTLEDGPPTSICRIQYLEMTDAVPTAEREERYRVRFDRLVRAIEENELDFGGGQARLQRLLRPLDFTRQMERHIASFTGRLWLLADVDAWLASPTGSRVLWLTGGPGIGKSAIATHLCHRRGEVIAHHFCVHGDDDKASPTRAILSIAFQMAAHLPEYHRRLQALALEEEVAKNPATLFDRIVVQPLAKDFPAPDGPRLVIIDALDEATRVDSGGRLQNAIAQLVHEQWQHVPAWLRLFITSRPESELLDELHHLNPLVIDAQRPENLADIRAFLATELPRRKDVPHDEQTIAAIIERSEGVFLYATELLNEIDAGRETLTRLDELPEGMKGHYRKFFMRQMPDLAVYRREIRPMLECISASREPLPLAMLAQATEVGDVDLRSQLALVGSLFPIRAGHEASEEGTTVAPFHKSVRDWLIEIDPKTQRPWAGDYAVDLAQGEKRLAEACMRLYRSGPEEMSAYALRHGPGHLLAVGRAADAADLMTDFAFHYERLRRLGRCEVVNVTADLALADKGLGAGPELREDLSIWKAFHDGNAHLLRREVRDLAPEICLLQLAAAHADASPVTRSAEAWLKSSGSDTHWLRSLRRPQKVERSACLRTFEGHRDRVYAVAVLPDGRRAISGGNDKTLKLWDLQTGQCLATFAGHRGEVRAVAVLPDGRRAISGGGDTLKLWDLHTRECLATFEAQTSGIRTVAVLPDGCKAISGGFDKILRLWDLQTGTCLRTFEGHKAPVMAVAVLPDGRRAISASSDLRLWDLQTGQCLRTFGEGWWQALAVLPDGRRAVSAGVTHLALWDLETGECLRTFEGEFCVAVLPDGRRVISAKWDETWDLKLWDLQTGECLGTFDGGHIGEMTAVAVLPDGRRAISASYDETLKLCDLQTAECMRAFEGQTRAVTAVAVLPDGRRAISANSGNKSGIGDLRLWDLRTGQCLRTLGASMVQAVAVLPDGRRAIEASWDSLKLWDLETGQHLHTFDKDTGLVTTVVVLADGRRAISAAAPSLLRPDPSLKLWDLQSGECLRTFVGHTEPVHAVAALCDGLRAISTSKDKTLKLWDLQTGRCLRTFVGHTDEVRSVSLLPDGRRALSASQDATLKLWDMQSGECLRTFEGHTGWVSAGTLPDGCRAISRSGDRTLKLWDIQTGECLRTFEGHTGAVCSAAVCPDGRRIISGGWDNTLKLWNLETGCCIATWQAATHVLRCATGPEVFLAGTGGGEMLFLKLMPPGPLTRTTLAIWSPSRARMTS
jgi:WD40 repeat protein